MTEEDSSLPVVSRNTSSNSSEISVDLSTSSSQKKQQVKLIRKMIKKARAYSLFHYDRARSWWRIYWITGFTTIVLSGILTIVNVVYPAENVKVTNVIINSSITAVIAIFSFMNPTDRRRDREEAGDRYAQLANDMIKDTFLNNKPVNSVNTERIIEVYSMRFNDYIENYFEPPREKFKKLLEDQDIEKEIVLRF